MSGSFDTSAARSPTADLGACPACLRSIPQGALTTVCPECHRAHHRDCWQASGCAACTPEEAAVEPIYLPPAANVLRITEEQLHQAIPTRVWTPPAPASRPAAVLPLPAPPPRRTSRLAIAAFVVALLGIPLFGLVTGLAAIIMGCIALASLPRRQPGGGLAAAAILVGALDVVGWTVGLALYTYDRNPGVSSAEFEPDPAALDELPPHLKRTMQSNVLIECRGGLSRLGAAGLGSGVILEINSGQALIVTNRHVIDPDFDDAATGERAGLPPEGSIHVKLVGQPSTSGRVLWMAPHGIDLAVLAVTVASAEAQAAVWDWERKSQIGASVFAIGNPHGLGWTHTQGTISQLRTQLRGSRSIRVIQTSAAINPGNSGGGLYDELGNLIGINTWTQDKRFSEGLGFAIAFGTLRDLAPPIPRLALTPEKAEP
ncbi:MAG: trypsin-like peptidase domain-containing protein [Planctomycetales bacterium]